MLKFVAVVGSLRIASYHRALIADLQRFAPEDVTIEVLELADLPMYNEDIEAEGLPAAVQAFRTALEQADGSIWATPEYNGAMSGAIKNAVDWASRGGILAKQPATVISASPGALGATKGQESLRAVLNHMGMYVLARPSLAIPRIQDKLIDGKLQDEATETFVRTWLEAFRDWARTFQS